MTLRYALTNEQWAGLSPLLPPQKPAIGRPALDHWKVIDGILWVPKSGGAWRDLPECYGNWKTLSSRFYRWTKADVWAQVLTALQEQADRRGDVDWRVHMIDGTIVRAHQSAAGAKGGSSTRPSVVLREASALRFT